MAARKKPPRSPSFEGVELDTRLARVLAGAEEAGVFGVPSYLVDDELFWGHERLGRARERLGWEARTAFEEGLALNIAWERRRTR